MTTNNSEKTAFSGKVFFRRLAAVLLVLLGVFCVFFVIHICVEYKDSKPILTFSPDIPKAQIVGFMDNVCAGDYTSAEGYLLGSPSMGIDAAPADEISALIWDAFISSTAYELSGDCYTTNDGLAQNISFSCMDITSVTQKLRERSQDLLKARVDAAEDVSEIYDENNEYRTDVVNEVMRQAVKDALKEDAKMITTEATIYLKYQDGQWWIQADQALLDVLFGNILFY